MYDRELGTLWDDAEVHSTSRLAGQLGFWSRVEELYTAGGRGGLPLATWVSELRGASLEGRAKQADEREGEEQGGGGRSWC